MPSQASPVCSANEVLRVDAEHGDAKQPVDERQSLVETHFVILCDFGFEVFIAAVRIIEIAQSREADLAGDVAAQDGILGEGVPQTRQISVVTVAGTFPVLLRPPSADNARQLARKLHFVLGGGREDVEVFVAVV